SIHVDTKDHVQNICAHLLIILSRPSRLRVRLPISFARRNTVPEKGSASKVRVREGGFDGGFGIDEAAEVVGGGQRNAGLVDECVDLVCGQVGVEGAQHTGEACHV